MLPDEFFDLIAEIRTSMNLTLVLQRPPNRLEVWDGNRDTVGNASLMFLATEGTVDTDSLAEKSAPARLGWVMTNIPSIKADTLYLIQVGVRRDWFDTAAGVVHPNKEAVKRFDRVWRRFSTRLRFPTVARYTVTGAEASYSDVGYSAGAEDWFRQGRKLRQEGVANIEFLIPDATKA